MFDKIISDVISFKILRFIKILYIKIDSISGLILYEQLDWVEYDKKYQKHDCYHGNNLQKSVLVESCSSISTWHRYIQVLVSHRYIMKFEALDDYRKLAEAFFERARWLTMKDYGVFVTPFSTLGRGSPEFKIFASWFAQVSNWNLSDCEIKDL